MSALWGNMVGVWTVIVMLLFIGIWVWAWRKRHKKNFDRMARIPMEDSTRPENDSEENKL